MDMEEERNPFTLPSDEEVFKMRDEEKRRKKEYRETQSKLKVWEKTTRGKLPTGAERLRQLIGEEAAAKPKTRKAKVKTMRRLSSLMRTCRVSPPFVRL